MQPIDFKKTVSVVIMIFSCAILSSANNAALLQKLDSVIEASETIVAEKNKKSDVSVSYDGIHGVCHDDSISPKGKDNRYGERPGRGTTDWCQCES